MNALVLAYGFIWVAVFGYVVLMGLKVKRLNAEMEELRRRITKASPG
jgi:CcmD family protein